MLTCGDARSVASSRSTCAGVRLCSVLSTRWWSCTQVRTRTGACHMGTCHLGAFVASDVHGMGCGIEVGHASERQGQGVCLSTHRRTHARARAAGTPFSWVWAGLLGQSLALEEACPERLCTCDQVVRTSAASWARPHLAHHQREREHTAVCSLNTPAPAITFLCCHARALQPNSLCTSGRHVCKPGSNRELIGPD